MSSRVYLVAVAAALACPGCGGRAAAAPVRVSATRPLMGVPWTITVFADDRIGGERAIAAGFAEAARLERILSDYDPGSELSRLSAASPTPGPVPVSDDLWGMLEAAERVRRLTDGAFDVTVGPLTSLWRQARRTRRLPPAGRLAAAREAVGGDAMVLDRETRRVSLTRPGMRLDPGGIGMGLAADRVLAVLAATGVESAMVDASGDVAVSGPPPGGEGWRIAVRGMPGDEGADVLVLAHAAVTTSGDARQHVEIDGRRYSHVIDPRSGLGIPGPAAVTVVAADCATADAVATAANVLGPEAGPGVLARFPGASARFVWQDGPTMRSLVTPGWPSR